MWRKLSDLGDPKWVTGGPLKGRMNPARAHKLILDMLSRVLVSKDLVGLWFELGTKRNPLWYTAT